MGTILGSPISETPIHDLFPEDSKYTNSTCLEGSKVYK